MGSRARCPRNGAHPGKAGDATTQEITQLSLAFANALIFSDRKDVVLTLG